jgi:hypothetical protein
MMGRTAIIAAALFGASAVHAKGGHYNIMGAGSLSCGSYVSAYEGYRPYANGVSGLLAMHAATSFFQYEAWIQGYIVGLNAMTAGNMRSIDEAGLQVWVYNYCSAYPLKKVVDAASQLYVELGGTIPKELRGSDK